MAFFKEKEAFPKLICENCGYTNELTFHPRLDYGRVQRYQCVECLQYAFWTNYWGKQHVQEFIAFTTGGMVSEVIHTKKLTLKQLMVPALC